jgi:amino acid transporter
MSETGLKKDAITFLSNVVIGVASTAPAYSLAAALPALVMYAQYGSPAIIVVAFIPMLFIAVAYYHLNRADPDCGTTFAWTTRALGPYAGWMGGWAIIATDILVMPGLAQVAGTYSLQLVCLPTTTFAVTAVGVIWIVLMTAICYLGIELSAKIQKFLLGAEVVALTVFAVVALVKAHAGATPGTLPFSLHWFNPFTVDDSSDFTQAMLVAVFIYWGWDTGTSVNEETKNPKIAPARAAIVSTLLLVGIYVMVTVAAVAFDEPTLKNYSGNDLLIPLGSQVLGPVMNKVLMLAVLTSAAACTQTTIMPTARTVISMARTGALPKKFAEIHPLHFTPGFATLVMGAASIVWYLALTFFSNENVLLDSLTATAIGIAFYYGLTGFACVVYYRRELRKSFKSLLLIGVVPALGGLIMLVLFVEACVSYYNPAEDKTSFEGIGTPVIFGAGALVLGFVLMLLARVGLPNFFKRKREVVDPALVAAE